MTYPKIAIIILNWNGKEDTIECLESLKHITYPNYEILLVDNGSTDGSVECLRERYPEMEIIENGENLGFAEGNNVAIRKAMENNTDYLLLLNNDTIVDSNFLTELVQAAESSHEIGIIGPKIYFYNDITRIQSIGGLVNRYTGRTPLIGCNINDVGQFDEKRDVDYVSGCALLIKTSVIEKIGVLCSDYFAYYEEVEWCIQAKKYGYRVVNVPTAHIWHKEAVTSKRSNSYTYLYTRNRFIFLKRNVNYLQRMTAIIFFFCTYFMFNTFNYMKSGDLETLSTFYKAILDGIRYHG